VPLIGILSNIGAVRFNLGDVILLWIVITAFLFAIWHSNIVIDLHLGTKSLAIRRFLLLMLIGIFYGLFVIVYLLLMPRSLRVSRSFLPSLVFFRIAIGIFIILTIQRAIATAQQKETALLHNQQLQNENLAARFAILKQQINPHFLFNALSTLRSLVRSGDPKAEPFVINLADVYRHLLRQRDTSSSTIEEELDFLRRYVFMLQARFEEALQIEINTPARITNKSIPALGLQLLVENCIKHNIVSVSKPLHIKVYTIDEEYVAVENNYQPKAFKENSEGLGLENLRSRYELLGVLDGVRVNQTDEIFRVCLKFL
jgi:LytS/YehU family sensor histidine kinase